MRRTFSLSLTLAACFCGFSSGLAQPPQEGPGGRGGFGRMPISPVQTALDANGDGQISAEELKDAEAKLKKLDANGDGVISAEELRPAGARGFGGPGGPGGFGGGGPGAGSAEGLVSTIMGFDANKDGKVTKEEAPERLQGLFERADADKDGALTKSEIEKSVAGGMGGGRAGGREGGGRGGEMRPGRFGGGAGELGVPGNLVVMLARRAFEQQDANKDGNLSGEELTAVMKDNLKRIDTNTDGLVDLAELESLAKIFEPRGGVEREGRGEGQSEGGRRPERE